MPCGILVGEWTLAPSAIGVLLRLEPRHRALDPRFVHATADRAQSGKRGAGPVDVIDAPAPPPSSPGRLVALQPFDGAFRDRMIRAIADRGHHLEHVAGEIRTC